MLALLCIVIVAILVFFYVACLSIPAELSKITVYTSIAENCYFSNEKYSCTFGPHSERSLIEVTEEELTARIMDLRKTGFVGKETNLKESHGDCLNIPGHSVCVVDEKSKPEKIDPDKEIEIRNTVINMISNRNNV